MKISQVSTGSCSNITSCGLPIIGATWLSQGITSNVIPDWSAIPPGWLNLSAIRATISRSSTTSPEDATKTLSLLKSRLPPKFASHKSISYWGILKCSEYPWFLIFSLRWLLYISPSKCVNALCIVSICWFRSSQFWGSISQFRILAKAVSRVVVILLRNLWNHFEW